MFLIDLTNIDSVWLLYRDRKDEHDRYKINVFH